MSDTSSGGIRPPVQAGEHWRKAHKTPASLAKVFREIKRPFVQYLYAPLDIVFRRAAILKQAEIEYPKILTLNETADLMINGTSICRYGDAEFDFIRNYLNLTESTPEKTLAQRLDQILAAPFTEQNRTEQLLVAVPPFRPQHEHFSKKYGWYNVWENYWSQHWPVLRSKLKGRTFGNSFISRYAAFHEVSIEKFRQIWSGRDVVFITGKNGRFFDEPRLFDCIRSSEYLFVEPVQAYKHYDSVLQQALAFDKNKLFIICAGAMATVLAFDLYHQGYQALDLGHLPNCYRQYLQEAPRPEILAEVIVR